MINYVHHDARVKIKKNNENNRIVSICLNFECEENKVANNVIAMSK